MNIKIEIVESVTAVLDDAHLGHISVSRSRLVGVACYPPVAEGATGSNRYTEDHSSVTRSSLAFVLTSREGHKLDHVLLLRSKCRACHSFERCLDNPW